MKRIALVIGIICCSLSYVAAQCPVGQIEVIIDVEVDQYGSEVYWELVPTGNNCGTGTIFSGGNAAVGCNGGGMKINPAGGYSNNSSNSEGPWCLTEGDDYDIIFVDDFGDGGATFAVKIEGFPAYAFTGTGSNATFTFTA
ncbi:MAG: hypothetical protein IIA45_10515, partial [Bacteroidetes bacterium]|nr:hypothetical protein [Bacteroidota bacterium]